MLPLSGRTYRSSRRDDALATIRVILDNLKALRTAVDERRGQVLRARGRDGEQQTRDLISLVNRIALLEIDCHLLRADAYGKKNEDRLAGRGRSLGGDRKAIAASRIGLDRRDRDRTGSFPKPCRPRSVGRRAAKASTHGSSRIRCRAIACPPISLAVRASLAEEDLKAARRYLDLATTREYAQSPSGRLKYFEWAVANWKRDSQNTSLAASNSSDQHSAAINQLLQSKIEIGKRFGEYWKQRAKRFCSKRPGAVNVARTPSQSRRQLRWNF